MHNTTALLTPMIRIAVLSLFLMACDTEEPTPLATYTLSTQASPTEGGRITTSPSGSTFTEGQSVSLTAEANANWVFSHWEGAASGSTRPLTLTMDANKSITGIFIKREYPLSITVEGEGTVTEEIVTNPSGREYPHGTTVELTPVPEEGWVFDSWGGDLSGNEVPKQITVDDEKHVTAKFKIREYPLTITIQGEGTVTEEVVTHPAGREYPQGTIVELTPVPAEGWVFESWGGDLSGNEIPTRITVDREKTVTVIFKEASTGLFYLAENGVTCKCEGANPGDKGFINGVEYEAVDNELIRQRRDQGVDMTKLCTSLVTDMTRLFYLERDFNQAIGNWDVSNVTTMERIFTGSRFNQPIEDWNVSNVRNMSGMFGASIFDYPIGKWNVGNVTTMLGMFGESQFNQPIGDWDVSKVTDMGVMFSGSPFNQSIGDWDVSNVTNMGGMFNGSPFNQSIGNWDVSNVINMEGMFANTPFNQPIGDWDVANVTDMAAMFQRSQFNQPIGGWNIGKAINISGMFLESPFNQSIENWDVSNVTTMWGIFRDSQFNQPIGNWNVSKVINMGEMFSGSPFNHPVENWNVGSVIIMQRMFVNSPFNQPIGDWNVSNVINMVEMFLANSAFNQDLSKWCVTRIPTRPFGFRVGATAWTLPEPDWGTCPE
ncbi:MAG: DUF285 domain-containing protein [Lunatimonas sp.]|uniref:BspA family leucine-rich repeat surface protein n=1 Tax=Lunatimonas sp. TaxID=2060141 RepID=UPI00263A80C1|nr:BspA family leucine-rich repeat surface protein [Lunatimonas sp.]MCC5939130.1 DUF285 domain-containing protein [Lunatimonas sp.]